jgi:hypothetical protein
MVKDKTHTLYIHQVAAHCFLPQCATCMKSRLLAAPSAHFHSHTHSLTQQRTRSAWAFLSNSVVKTNAKKRCRRKINWLCSFVAFILYYYARLDRKIYICRAARTWQTIANKSRLVVRERCDLFP